jgi:Reverse transcriptase (RNA-dependent DNA polymerase)
MIDRYSMMIDAMQEDYIAMSAMVMDYDKIDQIKFKDMFKCPQKFNEAWNHTDPWVQKKWRESNTKRALKNEMAYGVWRIIKRNEMDGGRECIKCKWVFEIKRDRTFRARLVACGYWQVPGVDFQESYRPVINDTVFRILIVCQVMWGLIAVLLDVEVAFLNGELEERIYMECPEGVV